MDVASGDTLAGRRILVVDDDGVTLDLVRTRLELAGFYVCTANSGREALAEIDRSGIPHLAIVDIHMPEMDGFEFCRVVQAYSDLPIILLSAADEEDVVVRGIDYFAEDYVRKPFSPRELVARVHRVLRRVGDFGYVTGRMISIDDHLEIDIAHQQVIVDGQYVPLTPTETKLLHILISNPGHVVSTRYLTRRLWPQEEVYEDALRVHVHRLRQKIEIDSRQPTYVVTERGVGYSFLCVA